MGVIAIVGRPNVGKSALFNRIVGKRIAIVHDEPGVTRDRLSAEAEWMGRPFTLIDTGGIGLLRGEKAQDLLSQAAFVQVQIAIESAQVILLVANLQEGLVPLDREVADRLRRAGKPVIVAVNKADNAKNEVSVGEYAELGFERIIPVSAIHGRGIPALMKAALSLLPRTAPPTKADDAAEKAEAVTPGTATLQARLTGPLKLAIVGRPNVGKSSLINSLTQSERVVVTPIPGTTRDAVDVPFEVETDGVRQKYILIDTAGLRKNLHGVSSVEFYSINRAEESIRRCDIVLLVLDAEAGILEQDKKIADLIVEAHKACIVVINKWDLVAPDVAEARQKERARTKNPRAHGQPAKVLTTLGEFGSWVQERLFFLDYAPVIFTSAKEGLHLDRLLEAVRYVASQLQQTIPTALLNRLLQQAVEQRQPVSTLGHRLNLFYATQTRSAPPTFLLFVNRNEIFSPAYHKYLAGELRRAFGYEGCPIVLVPKARPKTIEPKRQRSKSRTGR
jgi:GTP-binding protein